VVGASGPAQELARRPPHHAVSHGHHSSFPTFHTLPNPPTTLPCPALLCLVCLRLPKTREFACWNGWSHENDMVYARPLSDCPGSCNSRGACAHQQNTNRTYCICRKVCALPEHVLGFLSALFCRWGLVPLLSPLDLGACSARRVSRVPAASGRSPRRHAGSLPTAAATVRWWAGRERGGGEEGETGPQASEGKCCHAPLNPDSCLCSSSALPSSSLQGSACLAGACVRRATGAWTAAGPRHLTWRPGPTLCPRGEPSWPERRGRGRGRGSSLPFLPPSFCLMTSLTPPPTFNPSLSLPTTTLPQDPA
jgi:hypothetical protein